MIRGPYGREDARPEPAAEAGALVEALVTRGVAARMASELVATHPLSRIRTKLEVFDWLVQSGDKRVERNAAGYLVSSIRADYRDPADWTAKATKAAAREAERRTMEAERVRKAAAAVAEKAEADRTTELRTRWGELSGAQREAITVRVKAEHPGLRRWKSMLEPLCLDELERLMASGAEIPAMAEQGQLFGA